MCTDHVLVPVCLAPAGVGVSDNPGQLYNSMHSYLAASAIDGVKVDCQVHGGVFCWGGVGWGVAMWAEFFVGGLQWHSRQCVDAV